MSRSVKIFYPWHSAPATTCWLIWRMAIVLLLMQLVDSLPPLNDNGHSYEWWLSDPTRDRPHGNRIPENKRQSSTFRFKNSDFEFSYDVSNVNAIPPSNIIPSSKHDRDMINKAIAVIRNRLSYLERMFWLEFSGSGSKIPDLKIPPDCQSDIICQVKDSYPVEAVKKIMKNYLGLKNLIPAYEAPVADRSSEYTKNLCHDHEEKSSPTYIRFNMSASWQIVVNYDNFEQQMGLSYCSNPGATCGESIGTDYETVCKQQYSQQLMIVFNEVMIPRAEIFRIPFGCCCHKERIGPSGNTNHHGAAQYQNWRH